MRKFESSQKDESRAQSADSSKADRKPKVFNCQIKAVLISEILKLLKFVTAWYETVWK